MATVVPAEGVILKRVLEASPAIALEGLSREAAKFGAAQMKTAWGRHHQRRFALVDGDDVLASATQYDLAAVFEQRPVRVFGIGDSHTARTPRGGRWSSWNGCSTKRRATELRLRCFSDISHEHQPTGFDVVAMREAELSVAESSRRGAPMTLIRGGEERDLAAIVAMGQVRASSFRFHLDRDVDFVKYAITKKRLLADSVRQRAPTALLHCRRRHHGRCLCRRQHHRTHVDARGVRRP